MMSDKPTLTHYIVSMTRGETKGSKSPMWRCKTQDGERVNVFKHSDPLKNSARFFEAAGFLAEMEAMVVGQEITWWNSPIGIGMVKSGDWWEITHVRPRLEGELPDPVPVPDHKLFVSRAQTWAASIRGWSPECSPVIYLDTETTGTGPDDEIVSIAALDPEGRAVLQSLIRPTDPDRLLRVDPKSGKSAADITGITPDMLASAPTFPDLYEQIDAELHGFVWIIYNAAFDARMVEQDCLRHGLAPIAPLAVADAMQMFAEFYGEWTPVYRHFVSKSLSFAAEHLGVEPGTAHDALGDAQTLYRVVGELARRNYEEHN